MAVVVDLLKATLKLILLSTDILSLIVFVRLIFCKSLAIWTFRHKGRMWDDVSLFYCCDPALNVDDVLKPNNKIT